MEINQKFYEQIIESSARFIDYDKYLTIIDIAIENSSNAWLSHEIQVQI